MSGVESFGNCADRGAAGNRHAQFIRLTRIARIDGAIEAAATGVDAGALEHGAAFSFQGSENGLEGGRGRPLRPWW